jgi:hypothetical protein
MTPDYVFGGFPRKVGSRIGWGDEGCVWRRGREGVLRDTRFGGAKDGAEDRNEKFPAFLSEGITKRTVCTAGRDGLHRQTGTGWMGV